VKKYLKQVLIETQREKNVTGGRQKDETLKEVYRVYNKIKMMMHVFVSVVVRLQYIYCLYIYIYKN
jgi:hypothetical protein